MNRLSSLDYLRGLSALSILLYHYLYLVLPLDPNTLLSRVGIFGVPVFYILSGMTLTHVYQKKSKQPFNIGDFIKKRIFRIFPLFWLATILASLIKKPTFDVILENLTGVFAFLDWDKTIVPGGWSIGNELIFYIFFPLFLFLSINYRAAFAILYSITLAVFCYFSFYLLSPHVDLAEQWSRYSNPFNQLFLFTSGIAIVTFFKDLKINTWLSLSFVLMGALAIILYKTHSDNRAILVFGTTRMILTTSCLFICFGFYKTEFSFPDLVHKPLSFLGDISYSMYLFHYTIMDIVKAINKRTIDLDYFFLIPIATVTTLVVSYLVYQHYEKFFIKMARGKSKLVTS